MIISSKLGTGSSHSVLVTILTETKREACSEVTAAGESLKLGMQKK